MCVCSVVSDCSLWGSFVHEILAARILEWVAISSSRASSWPMDWTCVSCVSCIGGRFFTTEVFVNVFESMIKAFPPPPFLNLNDFKPIERWKNNMNTHLPFSWIDLLLTFCSFHLSFFCLYFPSLLKVGDTLYLCFRSLLCLSFSRVLLCDPMDYSPWGSPGSSVRGILQAEYWSGLPLPSSGDLPDPGMEPGSPTWQAHCLPSETPRKAA